MLIHSNHAASSIYNHCRRFAPFLITSVGLTQKGVAISTPFCLLRISIAAFIESRNSAASCNLPLSKICPPPSTTLCCRNISLHGAFQSRECLLCNSLFFFLPSVLQLVYHVHQVWNDGGIQRLHESGLTILTNIFVRGREGGGGGTGWRAHFLIW